MAIYEHENGLIKEKKLKMPKRRRKTVLYINTGGSINIIRNHDHLKKMKKLKQ